MKRFFDSELESLRSHLFHMGEIVIDQLQSALAAYASHDPTAAQAAIEADNEIDALEIRIDDEAIRYMTLRSPIATELRLVITGMKTSHDLERAGDEVTKIARRVRHLSSHPPLKTVTDVVKMGGIAGNMLRDALECFFEGTEDRAFEICRRDSEVDQLNRDLCDELTQLMMRDPATVSRAVDVMAISKAIERIADHATNIAEETIFLLNAKDVRHSADVRRAPESPAAPAV